MFFFLTMNMICQKYYSKKYGIMRKIRLAKARLIFLGKQTLMSPSVMGECDVFYVSCFAISIISSTYPPPCFSFRQCRLSFLP